MEDEESNQMSADENNHTCTDGERKLPNKCAKLTRRTVLGNRSTVASEVLQSRITCSACYNQVVTSKPDSLYCHPVLGVLICKKCYKYYTSGSIRTGDDGKDEECRWCAQGGNLICCDECHNSFCKDCIKQNLGRNAVKEATKDGGHWRCYVCHPKPLENLVSHCSAVLEAVKRSRASDINLTVAPGKPMKPAVSPSTQNVLDCDARFDTVFSESDIWTIVDQLKAVIIPLHSAIIDIEKHRDNSQSSVLANEIMSDLKLKIVESCKVLNNIGDTSKLKSAKPVNQAHDCTSNSSVIVEQNGNNDEVPHNNFSGMELLTSSEKTVVMPQLKQQHCDKESVDGKISDSSSDSSDEDLASDTSDSTSSTSDDEYNPKTDRQNTRAIEKSERQQSASKTKVKSALKKVQEIRDRIKQTRLKHAQKEKREKKTDRQSNDDDSSSSAEASQLAKSNDTARSVEDQGGNDVDVRDASCDHNSAVSASDSSDDVVSECEASNTNRSKGKKCDEKLDIKHTDEDGSVCNSLSSDSVAIKNMTVSESLKSKGNVESGSDGKELLDKEINKLGKMPKITIKLHRLSGEIVASDTSIKVQPKKLTGKEESWTNSVTNVNGDNRKGKQSSRLNDLEDLSSGGEEDSADKAGCEVPSEADGDNGNVESTAANDRDLQARNALLAEKRGDSSDDENDNDDDENLDNSDSSDGSDLCKPDGKAPSTKSRKKTPGNTAAEEQNSSDDFEAPTHKRKKLSSKLLSANLSDSDIDSKTQEKLADDGKSDDSDVAVVKRTKKRKRKQSSESNDNNDDDEDLSSSEEKSRNAKGKKTKARRRRIKNASSASESEDKEEEEEGSDCDDNGSSDGSPSKGPKRKKIRKILDKKLSEKTVNAAKAEQERRERIEERQKLFNQITVEDTTSPMKCTKTTKLVLEADAGNKEAVIEVHKDLICKLKPHQVEAVKFMWNCCVESLERLKNEDGSGCILAHCMGLGKTLSVITFVHTMLSNIEKTKMKTCLVLCPLNTVLNWQAEFENWLEDVGPLDVYEMSSVKDNAGRSALLKDWHTDGGVMLMGYEMFRNLSQLSRVKNKKQKIIFTETLLNPGPDLIVCDEGHVLKNEATGLSKATNQIRSKRRIVLTGTPLQNNLSEYHCMVNFVKPDLLGSRKEFCNRFVNPIMNGQCSDSSAYDVKLMKRRAHILHDMLAGCVQRKDYSALTKFLLPKHEYVISVRLSKVQADLYSKYLDRLQATCGDLTGSVIRGARIFTDYQNLMKIWTHPWVLKMDEIRQETKRLNAYNSDDESFIDDSEIESDGSKKSSKEDSDDVIELGSDDDWMPKRTTRRTAAIKQEQDGVKTASPRERKGRSKDDKKSKDSGSDKEIVKGWKTKSRSGEDKDGGSNDIIDGESQESTDKVSSEWWAEFVTSEDQYKLELSGKLLLLAEILKLAESIGDKVLVFSQSLLSLNLIEAFLAHWDKLVAADPDAQVAGIQGWDRGIDYVRMDGSTSALNRREWSDMFNDAENTKVRLFLISTRAGCLGINLVAANRVVIFDASWNPTHDVQSIFRVYRFGQQKPVYVYRLLAQGTMEEKIYERQVTKQSLSQRVIDEHQIERHFTANDLRELYVFKPDRLDDPNRPVRPTPKLPKDRLLAELLTKHSDWIVQYHEHDSLLENKIEEELTEDERKAAWEEYEQEKKGLLRQPQMSNSMQNIMMQSGAMMSGMQPYSQSEVMQNMSTYNASITSAHQIAKAIFSANPGISQVELTRRVTEYLQQLHLQQREYRLALEREKWQRLQEERQRQESLVQNYARGGSYSGVSAAGGTTDPSLDRDLMSILMDGRSSRQPNSAAAAVAPPYSGQELMQRLVNMSKGTTPEQTRDRGVNSPAENRAPSVPARSSPSSVHDAEPIQL